MYGPRQTGWRADAEVKGDKHSSVNIPAVKKMGRSHFVYISENQEDLYALLLIHRNFDKLGGGKCFQRQISKGQRYCKMPVRE